MGKRASDSPPAIKPEMDHLNALIPADLKRRMLIARANTGKPMTSLLVEWIEAGLAKVEAKSPASKR